MPTTVAGPSTDPGLRGRVRVSIPAELEDSLPPAVLDLVTLDLVQGNRMQLEILNLAVERGMQLEDAKKLVYPAFRETSSYLEVVLRARGKPTSLTFGSAARQDFDDAFIPFTRVISIAQVLMGISNVNGGGPGIMEMTAREIWKAREIADVHSYLRHYDPETYQVLLHIGKEAPHKYCRKENTVWPIDNLTARTAMLFTLGVPLIACYYPGGIGTLEELPRAVASNQLHGRIRTAFERPVPIILLDFRMKNRKFWWAPQREQAKSMLEYGTIKKEDLDTIHVVDVRDPSAPEQVLTILDRSARETFGYSFIDRWEQENSASLIETARRLAA